MWHAAVISQVRLCSGLERVSKPPLSSIARTSQRPLSHSVLEAHNVPERFRQLLMHIAASSIPISGSHLDSLSVVAADSAHDDEVNARPRRNHPFRHEWYASPRPTSTDWCGLGGPCGPCRSLCETNYEAPRQDG
jgi:hypothetical protein